MRQLLYNHLEYSLVSRGDIQIVKYISSEDHLNIYWLKTNVVTFVGMNVVDYNQNLFTV